MLKIITHITRALVSRQGLVLLPYRVSTTTSPSVGPHIPICRYMYVYIDICGIHLHISGLTRKLVGVSSSVYNCELPEHITYNIVLGVSPHQPLCHSFCHTDSAVAT